MVAQRSPQDDTDAEASVRSVLANALNAGDLSVDVLPGDVEAGDRIVRALGLDPTGMLATLIGYCGGVLVDHGWLRLLGSGARGLADVATATAGFIDPVTADPDGERLGGRGALVVAYDVLGGRFAVNLGALPGPMLDLCYWGPDTLEWTPLGATYDAFPTWATSAALAGFYADLRWEGWQEEVAAVGPGDGLVCYPFLSRADGRDISLSVRSAVPFSELLGLQDDLARQVGYLPGAPTSSLHS